MSITSISVNGQQYSVDVSQSGESRTVNEQELRTVIKEITPGQLDQVERDLLKSGISIRLPCGGVISEEQQLDTLATLEGIAPVDVSTDALEFMKIFQQCATLMRQTERENRATQLSVQVGALLSAADKMKSAADKRLAAGIAQGVMGIIGGCVQAGGGAKQIEQASLAMGASYKSVQSNTDAHGLEEQSHAMQAVNPAQAHAFHQQAAYAGAEAGRYNADAMHYSSNAQAYGQLGAGAGALVNAGSGIISSAVTHEADLDEVAKSRLETDAKVYETAFQNSNEMMQSAQEVIQDMKEKAAAVVQAQSESTRGIARNI